MGGTGWKEHGRERETTGENEGGLQLRVGGKRVVGWSRPGHGEKEGPGGEKKGENNKAPVGAYILGKNCRGRKRMRGNRRGEGQDDGNLPADILCVSCERESGRFPAPLPTYLHGALDPLLHVPLALPPLFASLGFRRLH